MFKMQAEGDIPIEFVAVDDPPGARFLSQMRIYLAVVPVSSRYCKSSRTLWSK